MGYILFEDIYLFASAAPFKATGPIVVIDVDRTSIKIKWLPPKDDGGSPVTGYIIEKREASSKSWSKEDKVADFVTEYRINNLKEKTEYHFRVIAVNEIGKSEPLETSEATLARSKFGKLFYIYNKLFGN